mmetsp:Transcript_11468/g.17180  ORF Transcript_11468/g.17180 Transcript_11468/m.17180 type:complete len:281 (-) Transcript_11468:487-1329(-)
MRTIGTSHMITSCIFLNLNLAVWTRLDSILKIRQVLTECTFFSLHIHFITVRILAMICTTTFKTHLSFTHRACKEFVLNLGWINHDWNRTLLVGTPTSIWILAELTQSTKLTKFGVHRTTTNTTHLLVGWRLVAILLRTYNFKDITTVDFSVHLLLDTLSAKIMITIKRNHIVGTNIFPTHRALNCRSIWIINVHISVNFLNWIEIWINIDGNAQFSWDFGFGMFLFSLFKLGQHILELLFLLVRTCLCKSFVDVHFKLTHSNSRRCQNLTGQTIRIVSN